MKRMLAGLALCALLLAGCSSTDAASAADADGTAQPTAAASAAANPDSSLYSDRDWNPGYDGAQTIDCTGSEDISITKAGVYLLTGTLEGQIAVAVGKEEKVQLVLQDLTVTSPDGPALWVQSADKVFLTLPAGSVSTLTDSTTYSSLTDDEPNAAVFCDADLTIQGEGTLNVTGSYHHAIRSKDDLTVTGGILNLAAAGDGLKAKRTLAVGGGTLTVTGSDEAVEANNIYITGGTLVLTAEDDGINAASPDNWTGDAPSLEIRGGTVVVDAEGDGLDSNGSMLVSGGVLLIAGPTRQGNGALDAETDLTVTGGTVIAVSSGGMDVNFGSASTQGSWLVSTGNQAGGTSLTLVDDTGAVLAHWTPGKSYSTAVLSSPGMVQGGSYTLYTGATVEETDAHGFAASGSAENGTEAASVTLESLLQSDAGLGGFAGPGGMGGERGGRGGMGGEMGGPMGQDGGPPALPDGEGFDGAPPEMPEGENFAGDPPQMPDGGEFGGEAPADGGFGGPDGEPPEMPDGGLDN